MSLVVGEKPLAWQHAGGFFVSALASCCERRKNMSRNHRSGSCKKARQKNTGLILGVE